MDKEKIEFISYNTNLIEEVDNFTKELFKAICYKINTTLPFEKSHKLFLNIQEQLKNEFSQNFWIDFESHLKKIRRSIDKDARAFEKTDPAVKSLQEIYLAYPGFYAITIYRLSNLVYQLKSFTLARMMSEYAHRRTGIDIHPGAKIGVPFFIDHGTGIVIGETTVIKNNVKIYQGVTLGGLQVKKELASIKRHPTIEDNVTIYANATILGGKIAIGKNSIIGANVWITKSVAENSTVLNKPEIIIKKNE